MKKLLLFAIGFALLSWACDRGPKADEVAGRTAQAYYEQLLQGKYDQFVDAQYRPDPIPPTYREQLIANAKMFVGEQQELHRGIKQVKFMRAEVDTAGHVADVFLVFVYGDSTNEEVVVPMVNHKGVWYLR